MRPDVVEAAVLRGMTQGLTKDDCKALDADEASEVARRLIEESKRLRYDDTRKDRPMSALTCGQLADMIESVADKDTNDVGVEVAIETIRDADMAVIEWLCRLVPRATVAALRAHEQTPLWGGGAAKPSEIGGES